MWHATYRFKTNDQSKNLNSDELIDEIEQLLVMTFYNADIFLSSKKITLLQSKKGKSKVLTSNEKHVIELESFFQR